MSKVVRVKVVQSGAVKTMTELVAQRMVAAAPKDYVILESPIIEVVSLPPVQKKSVEVAEEGKPFDIGNVPSRLATEQHVTTQTTQDVLTPKRGRPFKNQA